MSDFDPTPSAQTVTADEWRKRMPRYVSTAAREIAAEIMNDIADEQPDGGHYALAQWIDAFTSSLAAADARGKRLEAPFRNVDDLDWRNLLSFIAWTPDQFWEYVGGLVGEFEAGQMRDMLAAKGLAVTSPSNARGLVLMPREATAEMVSAAMGEIPEDECEFEHIEAAYRAMVLAIPSTHQSTPWDVHHNRSYEPVETRAKEIYDFFEFKDVGEKPAWVPGGNSLMQDEARICARKQLRDAGHAPAMSPAQGKAGAQ